MIVVCVILVKDQTIRTSRVYRIKSQERTPQAISGGGGGRQVRRRHRRRGCCGITFAARIVAELSKMRERKSKVAPTLQDLQTT